MPTSDAALVLAYLERAAPYAGAHRRIVNKASQGLRLKGVHDDGNASTIATAHRQLTVPRNGNHAGGAANLHQRARC